MSKHSVFTPRSPAAEGLFMGQHLRAWYFPGSTGRLVVTFDYRKQGRTGFLPANHSTGFARMGHAQLSIKSAANDWFINPDTPALEDVIRTVAAEHRSVHLMGYSMGGYGALRFASALQADTAVLISPQATIDRAVAPFETRFAMESAAFDANLGDIRAVAWPSLRGFVLVDPFVSWDLAHARLIGTLFPALRTVRLGFGGHPASRVVYSARKTCLIQQATVSLAPDPAAVQAAHRQGRRGGADYWLRLAGRADLRHPALATHARQTAAGLAAIPARDPAARSRVRLDGSADSA